QELRRCHRRFDQAGGRRHRVLRRGHLGRRLEHLRRDTVGRKGRARGTNQTLRLRRHHPGADQAV
ncbi:uncharacterized protein METZ01_LOCUS290186, partial [marine metagenome]